MASSVIAFSIQVLVIPHCWDVNDRQTTCKEGLSLVYVLGGCSPSQSRRGIRYEREGEETEANSIVEFSSPFLFSPQPQPTKGRHPHSEWIVVRSVLSGVPAQTAQDTAS